MLFKPLTARWFSIGISASVILGHLLLLGIIHIGIIDLKAHTQDALFELIIFYVLGTWLTSLVPLNLIVLPLLYWWDKRIASKESEDRPRVPENAFHALTFSGGYIGAWIGQTRFHHKVSKKSFQIKHYAVCFVSIGVYILLGYCFYNV